MKESTAISHTSTRKMEFIQSSKVPVSTVTPASNGKSTKPTTISLTPTSLHNKQEKSTQSLKQAPSTSKTMTSVSINKGISNNVNESKSTSIINNEGILKYYIRLLMLFICSLLFSIITFIADTCKLTNAEKFRGQRMQSYDLSLG